MPGLGELLVIAGGIVLLFFGGRFPMLLAGLRRQMEDEAMSRVRAEVERALHPEDPVDEADEADEPRQR